MAYEIEFAADRGSMFYAEIVMENILTGEAMPGDGSDIRLNVLGWREDYGDFNRYGYAVASKANGLITEPEPGLLVINVPQSRFFGITDATTGIWMGGFETQRRSLRFALTVVPTNADFTSTLATGTISFGDC